MKPLNITCNECGREAIPTHIEIVANPSRPSQIVELILTIKCPQCGPRKQPAPPDPKQDETKAQ
jgi:ribosomal protein S27E